VAIARSGWLRKYRTGKPSIESSRLQHQFQAFRFLGGLPSNAIEFLELSWSVAVISHCDSKAIPPGIRPLRPSENGPPGNGAVRECLILEAHQFDPVSRYIFSPFQTHEVKNARTFNQIASSKPSWIGQETIQPFQTSFLKPNRRTTLVSGKKVNRSAYAQSDPSGFRMIGNAAGKNFLLRHSYCKKSQWSLCLDNEIDALLDLEFRFYESHRWCVN
jgi:hypothetical protein